MNSLIDHLRHQVSAHLSDTEIVLLISDELPPLRKQEAERHLEECVKCQARYERFTRTERRVAEYSDYRAELHLRRPGARRDHLEVELAKLLRDGTPGYEIRQQERKAPSKRRLIRFPLPAMSPTLAIGMALALASVACVFIWLQQTRPRITSNTLLVRAETWDSGSANGPASGVVYQAVRIKTSKQVVDRTIFRDVQGRRKLKPHTLPLDQQQLKAKLAIAGVAWDAPLSAASYQGWHDRQRVRQDRIRRSGSHLLVLTTTTPEGDVAAQSLTVRDTDFHPVDRTIAFRDQETVEIAEVDYQVVPWNATNEAMFEPIGAVQSDLVRHVQVTPALHLPTVLSETQLDEVELGARLALNELHADTGEQIHIDRTPLGIEVKGLVETNQRKTDLVSQLRMLPHVSTSILSMEELKRNPENQPATTSVKVDSVSVNPSPLETYFVAQGRDANTLRSISQDLLSSALTASQETRSISDLLDRFASDQTMTDVAKATLTELIFAHRDKLAAALDEEQRLLGEAFQAVPASPPESTSAQAGAGSLVSVADKNLSLCEELALGSSSPPRKAEAIFPELAASLNALRVSARQAQTDFQNTTARNEKK